MRFPGRLVRDWTSKRGATRDPEAPYDIRSVFNPNDNRPEDDEPDVVPLVPAASPLIWGTAESQAATTEQPPPSVPQPSWWEQESGAQTLPPDVASIFEQPPIQEQEQQAASEMMMAQPHTPERDEIVEDYDPNKEEEELTLG